MPIGAPQDVVCNTLCNVEPSDAELERGVLDALAKGLDGVAKTLSSQLEERRRARVPANVVSIAERRGR